MSSVKSKSKHKASKQAADSASATVEARLLRYATRSLRQRYQRIVDDMDYWENIHSSFLLEKYLKQFISVRERFDKKIKFDPEEEPDDKESKAKESVTYAVALVGDFEKTIRSDLKRADLSEKLNFYKKRAEFLSSRTSVEIGPQTSWWIYFRVAMEQRMVPQYNDFLNKVDIIARDCYYPLLKALEDFTGTALKSQQDWLAPLTMLEFGGVYRTLSTQFAPVPNILVPFDRMDNVWNLCAIHHEVAHDFYHKLNSLKARGEQPVVSHFPKMIKAQLDSTLTLEEKNVSRFLGLDFYLNWSEEVSADLIGNLLAGPTYINSLMEILIDDDVDTIRQTYPSSFMRVILNAMFAGGQLGYWAETRDLLTEWLTIYSTPNIDSDVDTLPRKTRKMLMMLWLGQKTTKDLERKKAFETLYQACEELTRRLNIQGPRREQFDFIDRSESRQEVKQLTPISVMGWLLKLVEACWQAELVPGTGLSLSKIDIHMDKTGHKPNKEHIEATAAYIIEQITGKGSTSDQPDWCRPRHLVPATRLAFESLVLDDSNKTFEKNLRRYFLDYLNDSPEVAAAFKELQDRVQLPPEEQVPEPEGWDLEADYLSSWQVLSQTTHSY